MSHNRMRHIKGIAETAMLILTSVDGSPEPLAEDEMRQLYESFKRIVTLARPEIVETKADALNALDRLESERMYLVEDIVFGNPFDKNYCQNAHYLRDLAEACRKTREEGMAESEAQTMQATKKSERKGVKPTNLNQPHAKTKPSTEPSIKDPSIAPKRRAAKPKEGEA